VSVRIGVSSTRRCARIVAECRTDCVEKKLRLGMARKVALSRLSSSWTISYSLTTNILIISYDTFPSSHRCALIVITILICSVCVPYQFANTICSIYCWLQASCRRSITKGYLITSMNTENEDARSYTRQTCANQSPQFLQ
jgi:hypothetical protein